jgi:uncharacterized protein YbgA (DUF1722 family)
MTGALPKPGQAGTENDDTDAQLKRELSRLLADWEQELLDDSIGEFAERIIQVVRRRAW